MLNEFSKKENSYLYKKIIFFIFIFFSIYCALTIGIHWDIFTHLKSGNDKLKYIFSLGPLNTSFDQIQSRENYYWEKTIPGVSFAITSFVNNIFPKIYRVEVLHLSNLFISLVGVIGFGKLIKEFFNYRVSIISLILVCTFPVLFGHFAMNPKDTVVFTSYIWVTYLCIKYLTDNKKKKKYILLISFFLALGTGIRLFFISTLIPLIIFIFFEILYFKKMINYKIKYKEFFYDLIKIFLISFMILIIFWTETHNNIFVEPIKIFATLFNSPPVGAPYGIVNGEIYSIDETPVHYVILNLIFKTPEYILLCYVFFPLILISNYNFFSKIIKNFTYKTSLIYLTILVTFAIFYIFSPPFYDGMRTFLFIIPILLVIPSLTIYYAITNIHLKFSKIILFSLFPLIVLYVFEFISLTPLQYTYVNNFVKNPDTKFENDYLALSMRQLFEKSKFLNAENTKLAVCGAGKGQVKYYLRKYKYNNVRVVNMDEDFDYIVMTNRVNWSSVNSKVAKTCFKSYSGAIKSFVRKNKIYLSMIRQK